MTPPWNMIFSVFVLDARPFEELKRSLEVMLGGSFEEDPKSKADGRALYKNYLLGLDVGLAIEDTWPDGIVYRLAGVNDAGYYFVEGEEVDITFHVLQLLGNAGCVQLLSQEEFQRDPRRSSRRGTRDALL